VYEAAVVGHRGFLGSAISRVFSEHGAGVLGHAADSPIVAHGALAEGVESVSTVVWTAARVNPRLAVERPDLAAADVAEFAEFVELASALAYPPRVILISSGGTVYGANATPPFRESTELMPINAYGEVKARQEQILAESPLNGVALRVANAYGPGQRPAPGQAVLAHWMSAVLEKRPVSVLGDPSATRDYVYIDDIAAAVYAAHQAHPPLPPAINVGSGRATTLEQLLEALTLAVAPEVVAVERGTARATDASHSVLDVSLAQEVLGWTPRVGLEDGVRAMWDWMNS
jgi:UDP-glucose 4-epimerase